MKELFAVLFRNSQARDYAVATLVLGVIAVFGVQTISRLIDSTRQNVRIEQATIAAPKEDVRNYHVSRSVLDDTTVTGTISKQGGASRPIILDPCTGQVKSK